MIFYLFCAAHSHTEARNRFLKDHGTKEEIGLQIAQNTIEANPDKLISELNARMEETSQIVMKEHYWDLIQIATEVKTFVNTHQIMQDIVCIQI